MLSKSKNMIEHSNIVVDLQKAQKEVNKKLDIFCEVQSCISSESEIIHNTIDLVHEQDTRLINQDKELIELERRLMKIEDKYNFNEIKQDLKEAENKLIDLFYNYIVFAFEIKELDSKTYNTFLDLKSTIQTNIVERDFLINHILNIEF